MVYGDRLKVQHLVMPSWRYRLRAFGKQGSTSLELNIRYTPARDLHLGVFVL